MRAFLGVKLSQIGVKLRGRAIVFEVVEMFAGFADAFAFFVDGDVVAAQRVAAFTAGLLLRSGFGRVQGKRQNRNFALWQCSDTDGG